MALIDQSLSSELNIYIYIYILYLLQNFEILAFIPGTWDEFGLP